MPNDAITLIETDHQTVRQLFDKIRTADGDAKWRLVQQAIQEIKVHATVEEELLYPFVRTHVEGGTDLVSEATFEHQEAKGLMSRIESFGPTGLEFEELVTKLMEGVEHHAQEEESGMLPRLRDSASESQLTDLGGQLEALKSSTMPGPTMGGPAELDLRDMSKDELLEKAKEVGLKGRSKMKKDELIDALSHR